MLRGREGPVHIWQETRPGWAHLHKCVTNVIHSANLLLCKEDGTLQF